MNRKNRIASNDEISKALNKLNKNYSNTLKKLAD